jgi:hypothetical protein
VPEVDSPPSDTDESIFSKAVRQVLDEAEVRDAIGRPLNADDLRRHLYNRREDVSAATDVERVRFQRAATRAEDISDSRTTVKKSEHTWVWDLATPFFILLAALALSAVIGLVRELLDIIGLIRPTGLDIEVTYGALILSVPTIIIITLFINMDDRVLERRRKGSRRREAELAAVEIADAERDYLTALVQQLLGQAREKINESRKAHRFDTVLQVGGSPGLSQVYGDKYHVIGAADSYLEDMIRQMPGATIGVAGPRGIGKTSLIRQHCPKEIYVSEDGKDLSLLVSAPVEYVPKEFVLYILTTLCIAYLSYRKSTESLKPTSIIRVKNDLSSRKFVAMPRKLSNRKYLRPEAEDSARRAQEYLREARYLETFTGTTSASVSPPTGIFDLSRQSSTSRAEVPRSYPELVSEFRAFLEAVAAEVRSAGGRLIIGVDELDKISDPEQAQRFINEMKVILGVPNCYYLIAVSDDALASYEMRGLPVRDAFDSAFDEIIHVGYLRLDESRRLLSERVIGMYEPFICLCHCISGGLPRDLIRTARHTVASARLSAQTADDVTQTDSITFISHTLVLGELTAKLHATGVKIAGQSPLPTEAHFLYSLQRIASDPRGPHLPDRLARALSDIEETQGTLDTSVSGPIAELASYVFFLSTILEIFNEGLSKEKIRAGIRDNSGMSKFDQISLARRTLSTDPAQAWLAIAAIRRDWGIKKDRVESATQERSS